jgi:hypothetical protein
MSKEAVALVCGIAVIVLAIVLGVTSDNAALARQMQACRNGQDVECLVAMQDQAENRRWDRVVQYAHAYYQKTGKTLSL